MPKFNPNPTNLEIARRSQGLTRQELAYLSGVSVNTIKACEQGKRNINRSPVEDVVALSDVLHTPVRDLLNERGESDA